MGRSSIYPDRFADQDATIRLLALRNCARHSDRARRTNASSKPKLWTVNRSQTRNLRLLTQTHVQAVIDAATDISAARFDPSLQCSQREGRVLLRCLFVHSRVLAQSQCRGPYIFAPGFKREGTVLIEDVKKDSRYGRNSP
jgi:hypothetical protein